MTEKNVPRDFFLHAGAFISLYLGAIALITLLFSVINHIFIDPLSQVYYTNPYSGPMRFAIASLTILVPLTVYLFFKIQEETRKNPDRRSLGVRKWLTYITLFVAGATVIGDLIMLMDSFLGGALPAPFALKVLVILAVMGTGFGYFFFDIRGYWTTHAQYSRYVGIGVVCAVLVSVVGGMVLIGSPVTQRALGIDMQQINDLSMMQSAVTYYWEQSGELPDTIESIQNDVTGFRVPESIEGRPPYEYRKSATSTYELCATFDLPSPENNPAFEYGFGDESWAHEAGPVCFTRTVDPALLTPQINLKPVTVPVR